MAHSRTRSWCIAPVLLSVALAGTTHAQVQPHRDVEHVDRPAVVQQQAEDQQPETAQTGPRMVFDDLTHDFGRIPDSAAVEHTFRFTNRGDSTLVIQQPAASCGCTVPFMAKREYAPGEGGEISVRFNPHGRRGTQNQRITVNTNDPTSPQIVLQISAFVRTTIAFNPPSVNFGDVMAGQTKREQIRVQGPAPDFEVTYASTNRGRFVRVEVLETRQTVINGEDISETLLEFTLTAPKERGHFNSVSTVRTTSPVNPLADVHITAEIVGDLQVLPPRVNVGIIETGNPFHRMFRVNSRTGKPFNIINVDSTSNLAEPLDISWRPVQEDNKTAWQVDIRGTAPAHMAPINANLTIMTDQDLDPTLSVQMSGAVRPPQQQQQPAIEPLPAGIPARDELEDDARR